MNELKAWCAREVYLIHEKDPEYVWTRDWEKRWKGTAQPQAGQGDAGSGDVQGSGGGQSRNNVDLGRFFSQKMMPYIRGAQNHFGVSRQRETENNLGGAPGFVPKGAGAPAGLMFMGPR